MLAYKKDSNSKVNDRITMIRWMCPYTRLDKISNGVIRDLVKVVPIENKSREIRLR